MFTLKNDIKWGQVPYNLRELPVPIKQIFKMEPEPGQSDGSGSSQMHRLRAAPAPKPW